MSLRAIVYADYQECVRLAAIPDELRRALRAHERVPGFITNLVEQIGRTKGHVSRETIKTCVYDLTHMFLQNVNRKAEEDRMSQLAKSAIEARAAELEAISAAEVIDELA